MKEEIQEKTRERRLGKRLSKVNFHFTYHELDGESSPLEIKNYQDYIKDNKDYEVIPPKKDIFAVLHKERVYKNIEVYSASIAISSFLPTIDKIKKKLSYLENFVSKEIYKKFDEVDRKKVKTSLSFYVGKLYKEIIDDKGKVCLRFLKEYLKNDYSIKEEDVVFQYCSCAPREYRIELEKIGKIERVLCRYDAGFYRALGLEEKVLGKK